MFKKPALLAAFGIGYVLGARAGRERYDAILAKAQQLWQDPRVQEKAHHAGHVAKEKTETVRHTIQDKMPGDTTSSSASTSNTTTTDPVTNMPRGWES